MQQILGPRRLARRNITAWRTTARNSMNGKFGNIDLASRILWASGGAALLAGVVLAALMFVYMPIAGDGAWYSYPAYAWSQGGDPSENIPGIARPSPAPERPFAIFNWENRSNLTVPITAAWLKLFSPTWQTLKAFGLLQYLLLASVVWFCAFQITKSKRLAFIALCFSASDARVIAESAADARPDVFIAIIGVLLLALLLPNLKAPRPGLLATALPLCLALPLLHVSAAFTLAFIVAFLFLHARLSRQGGRSFSSLTVAMIISGTLAAAFALRQPLLDLASPTVVPASAELPYRHQLGEELRSFYNGNFPAKMLMEVKRWTDYFFFANTFHFLFIVLGFAAGVAALGMRARDQCVTMTRSLSGAFAIAVLAVVLTDSHPMWAHLLPLAVLAYITSCAALSTVSQSNSKLGNYLTYSCSALLLAGALLNGAHCASLYTSYKKQNVSNAAEEAMLLNALPSTGDIKVVGPTEIWPFLARRRQPLVLADLNRSVFLDNGGNLELSTVPGIEGAQYIVVNDQEIQIYRWGEAISQWQRQGLVTELGNVGTCEGKVPCLRLYAVEGAPKQF